MKETFDIYDIFLVLFLGLIAPSLFRILRHEFQEIIIKLKENKRNKSQGLNLSKRVMPEAQLEEKHLTGDALLISPEHEELRNAALRYIAVSKALQAHKGENLV